VLRVLSSGDMAMIAVKFEKQQLTTPARAAA
jgi:hypothetical protein